ncbi:MAG TPA: exodeoxyribonuclease VII large subunit [Saprospiraceae bacterium]|nr:exodeoxyribonuclease VII large subunit [Saprospiraceae bacterium]
MEAYSLVEVNQYIKQVIAANFLDSIWVQAEISQIKESRGAYYLELVEKKEHSDEVIASTGAVIWYKSVLFIRNKLKDLAHQILKEGIHIQCKVKVEFHEKYGLKFSIEDIDPTFTFGQMEIKRQQTIERLSKEELLHRNQQITLPRVFQKIAVISSSKAAGLEDFMDQLHNNRYGYAFHTVLFESSVQGQNLEREMIQALDLASKQDVDSIVIIRGGGSKLDLSGFDSYLLAKHAALCSKPILTGIGHETDQTIIELVVNSPLKTPTAVANLIIDHNLLFEHSVLNLNERINGQMEKKMIRYHQEVMDLMISIRHHSRSITERNRLQLQNKIDGVRHKALSLCQTWMNKIEMRSEQIRINDPSNILKKGFSLTMQQGKPVKSIVELNKAEPLVTVFADGKVESEIKMVFKQCN